MTLQAGDYKVAVFYAGGQQWYQTTVGYWASGGTGASGITSRTAHRAQHVRRHEPRSEQLSQSFPEWWNL